MSQSDIEQDPTAEETPAETVDAVDETVTAEQVEAVEDGVERGRRGRGGR